MNICALYSNVKSLFAALATALLLNCAAHASAEENRSGKAVYDYYCYQCHGYGGTANTLAATFLNPPPRNFTASLPELLTRERMIKSITHGRNNTGMVPFSKVLNGVEIIAVVDYIRSHFMTANPVPGYYHTAANGWPNHGRYQLAFPFADGSIALDTPWAELTEDQQAGKQLFLTSCVSCHDRGRVENEGPVWALHAISYPRNHGYIPEPDPVDALSGASIYMRHDIAPNIPDLTDAEQQGQELYKINCAFCHAADGTGRNWIGHFMVPPARDLTHPDIVAALPEEYLFHVIQEGLPGTSMPAWKAILSKDQTYSLIHFLKRAFSKPAVSDTDIPIIQRGKISSQPPVWVKSVISAPK